MDSVQEAYEDATCFHDETSAVNHEFQPCNTTYYKHKSHTEALCT